MPSKSVSFFSGNASVLELASWFAVSKGQNAKEGEFYKTTTELLAQENHTGVLSLFAKESGAMLEAEEKDMEALYNLMIALIHDAKPEEVAGLSATIVKPIMESSAEHAHVKLRILSNLYNSFDATFSGRYEVFTAIVAVAGKADEMEIVVPQLAALDSWIAEWGVTGNKSRALYLLISEQLEKSENFKREAYEFLLKYLSTFDGDSKAAAAAKDHALRAIKSAISIPTVLAFDELHKLDAVQALKSTKNFELLTIFLEGSLKQYHDFVKANPKFIAENGLSEEDCQSKMRLLSFASLAASNVQGEVPYATIASALDVSIDDVEVWVINTIRAGLVDAKMNQLKQTVVVSRSVHRVFTDAEWKTLQARLEAWRVNLKEVLTVVGNAKLINGGGATVEAVVQQ
ncbi:hypothetical protein HDU87_004383 [Geranomyces variabilis]|uniref:Eukaryotic translation initiation factor 3 subunit M n=1 Tax=Geranomyces variabilis TaxID=109894 RepID=A0AAD5TIM6_9FUNG|nr:hypothetical protein HDU87_004383 [Geranomyces variabilis]